MQLRLLSGVNLTEPTNYNMKRAIVILPFIIMLSVGGFACYKIKWPGTVETESPKYSLSSTRLFNEFQLVEMSASSRYTEQVIEVFGKIKEIRTSQDGKKYVNLEAGNTEFSIHCQLLPTEALRLINFRKGDEITLIGTCKGLMLDVLLVNCKID